MAKKAPSQNEPNEVQIVKDFESILEVLPHEPVALSTLYEVYRRQGNEIRALEYLAKLGRAMLAEADSQGAPAVLEIMESRHGSQEQLQELIQKLKAFIDSNTIAGSSTELLPSPTPPTGKIKRSDLTYELSLAWKLLQAEVLSEEDYSSMVNDLSENASKPLDVPVSVFHVLQDRGTKNQEHIIDTVVKDSGLPIISLGRFDIQQEAYCLLPLDFMKHRGAIVFERMGEEALVAILNPYNTQLQQEIQEQTGRKCHFYLTTAPDYDTALENIQQMLHASSGKN